MYIDSPDWIKNQKATINPINKKDDRCCNSQYAVTVALNREEIQKDPQNNVFVDRYIQEEINYPSE